MQPACLNVGATSVDDEIRNVALSSLIMHLQDAAFGDAQLGVSIVRSLVRHDWMPAAAAKLCPGRDVS